MHCGRLQADLEYKETNAYNLLMCAQMNASAVAHAESLAITEGVAAASQDPTLAVRVPAATALAGLAAACQDAPALAALLEAAMPILMAGDAGTDLVYRCLPISSRQAWMGT